MADFEITITNKEDEVSGVIRMVCSEHGQILCEFLFNDDWSHQKVEGDFSRLLAQHMKELHR